MGRGSVRRGDALLPGLLRCARCGRRLQVSYGGSGSLRSLRYACRGAFSERAESNCISFGGMRVDRAVAQEVIDRVQPLGVEAALAAMTSLEEEQSDKRRQLENALEQVRFEASRAHRQYDAGIRKIVSSPPTSNGAGMKGSSLYEPSKTSSCSSPRLRRPLFARRIENACSPWAAICRMPGTAPVSQSKHVKRSSGC